MSTVQSFLTAILKPLPAVQHTETIFTIKSYKETSEVLVAPATVGE